MHTQSLRVVLVLAVALVTALAGADRASAAGVVFIDACQRLSDANTTYKLTTNLTSCASCLIVNNNRITIDLQGHSITGVCGVGTGDGISDTPTGFDLITVKNGSIRTWANGVGLPRSTRVSVLGVTATDNFFAGIVVGPRGLVKASEVSGSQRGIVVGDRGQVQQCNVHDNGRGIDVNGDHCLITMNTANANLNVGVQIIGNKCTVSYNTASNNGVLGIRAIIGSGHLVTHNVAMGNTAFDFEVDCPSTVTYNDSTDGFPDSYNLSGTGCHLVNNLP